MSTDLALQVKNVVKRYPGVLALDEVSLEVRAGTITALVGENGAGKSTLMNVLSGLQRPESGSVRVFGRQVTRFDPHTLLADHRVQQVVVRAEHNRSVRQQLPRRKVGACPVLRVSGCTI